MTCNNFAEPQLTELHLHGGCRFVALFLALFFFLFKPGLGSKKTSFKFKSAKPGIFFFFALNSITS